MTRKMRMHGPTVCEMVTANQCARFNRSESLYCCEYLSSYEWIYSLLIEVIFYTDLAELICSTSAILIAIVINVLRRRQRPGIYIMAVSSMITAVATFSMVALISINDMMDTAQQIYDHGCLDRKHLEFVIDIKNEFIALLWIDTLEGCVDILALLILFYGIYIQHRADVESNIPSKAIYICLYIFRLVVAYVSYFKEEYPAYTNFLKVHDNPNAYCYKLERVTIATQSTSAL